MPDAMDFFSSLGVGPGAGGASKRARGPDGATTGDGGGSKLHARSIKALQGQVRGILGTIEETYIFEKDNAYGQTLRNTMTHYTNHKPARKEGEKNSGKHPWGPARWLLYACLAIQLIKDILADAALQERIKKMLPTAVDVLRNMMTLLDQVNTKAKAGSPGDAFLMVKDFVSYMETRETNDGRQILHIRPKDKILADTIGEASLIGVHPRVAWDLMSIPIRQKLEDGTAPPGPGERAIGASMYKDKKA